MIAKPQSLEDWTLPLIVELAASGISENDWFELKESVQGDADRLRKAAAAFANTQGGFIVFGVSNDRTVVGIKGGEVPRDFGNKLSHGVNPSVNFRFSAPIAAPSPDTCLWVCEVPRSERGPHAVLVNDHWVFPKRTGSGSNVSMSVDEIRATVLDSNRRVTELAWFRAEVDRIRELAERVNREATGGVARKIDLVLVRFDASRLKTLLVTVFSYLRKNPMLVEQIHALIEKCEKVDAVLVPAAAFALAPRDRSYSGSGTDWREFLLEQLPRIVQHGGLIVRWLDEL